MEAMRSKLIIFPALSVLMLLLLIQLAYAYSVSDFFNSIGEIINKVTSLFLPRPGGTDIVPTILKGSFLLSVSCTNHAECSRTCTSLCPQDEYGCCYGCKIGQCVSGTCTCVDAPTYCAHPLIQVGDKCIPPPTTTTTTTTTLAATELPTPSSIVFTTVNENNGELTVPISFTFTVSDTVYQRGINKNNIKYKVVDYNDYCNSGWKEVPAEKCQGNCEAWPGVCTCTLENFYIPLSYYVDYTSSYGFVLTTSLKMTISATSTSQNTLSSTTNFKVVKITQNKPPEISITSPLNESVLNVPFDVTFTAVDETGINKGSALYEILDLAGNVIEKKTVSSACPQASGVLTCELPGCSCSCAIKGISASLLPGNTYILHVNISDVSVPLTIYGPQQPNMVEPMQGSSGIVFTVAGASFKVTAFDCSQLAEGQYKCAVQYTNPLTEQVLFSFVFSKAGKAVVKTVTVSPGSGTAQVTLSCSESPGMNLVSWRAFRASNHKVPIAWSILTTLKSISC